VPCLGRAKMSGRGPGQRATGCMANYTMDRGMSQIFLRPIQQLVLVETLQSRCYAFPACGVLFREEKVSYVHHLSELMLSILHTLVLGMHIILLALVWIVTWNDCMIWIDLLLEYVKTLDAHDVNKPSISKNYM